MAVTVLVSLAVFAGAMASEATAARAKVRRGVFGTINGKSFKAKNTGSADDPCVNGIFRPGDGIVTFVALECRGRRRRQGTAVKKNYQLLVMACANFDPMVDVGALPLDIPCGGSGYTETKTGRFRIPVSMTTWGANFEFPPSGIPTSNVRMRIDAFDGSSLRGVIYGVFEESLVGPASPPAQIGDELFFDFPLRIQ
jgi:hypothetical protein